MSSIFNDSKILDHPSTTISWPSVISNGYFNVGQNIPVSAWFQSRFQCTLIALFVTPSCYWEIKFQTQCCYSVLNWPYILRAENIELLKKN